MVHIENVTYEGPRDCFPEEMLSYLEKQGRLEHLEGDEVRLTVQQYVQPGIEMNFERES